MDSYSWAFVYNPLPTFHPCIHPFMSTHDTSLGTLQVAESVIFCVSSYVRLLQVVILKIFQSVKFLLCNLGSFNPAVGLSCITV